MLFNKKGNSIYHNSIIFHTKYVIEYINNVEVFVILLVEHTFYY